MTIPKENELDDNADLLTDHFGEETELLKMDGYDDCIIGVVERIGLEPFIAYDRAKVIQKLVSQGMTGDEAEEYFEFNQLGAYVGASTPGFVTTLDALRRRTEVSFDPVAASYLNEGSVVCLELDSEEISEETLRAAVAAKIDQSGHVYVVSGPPETNGAVPLERVVGQVKKAPTGNVVEMEILSRGHEVMSLIQEGRIKMIPNGLIVRNRDGEVTDLHLTSLSIAWKEGPGSPGEA
jgi:hypothetical protein